MTGRRSFRAGRALRGPHLLLLLWRGRATLVLLGALRSIRDMADYGDTQRRGWDLHRAKLRSSLWPATVLSVEVWGSFGPEDRTATVVGQRDPNIDAGDSTNDWFDYVWH